MTTRLGQTPLGVQPYLPGALGGKTPYIPPEKLRITRLGLTPIGTEPYRLGLGGKTPYEPEPVELVARPPLFINGNVGRLMAR